MADFDVSRPGIDDPRTQGRWLEHLNSIVLPMLLGGVLGVVGVVVIGALFASGYGMLLPLLFFAGVGIFTRKIAGEERAWRDRVSAR